MTTCRTYTTTSTFPTPKKNNLVQTPLRMWGVSLLVAVGEHEQVGEIIKNNRMH